MPFERIEELTDIQKDHLCYLISHVEKYGFQPNILEMAEYFGKTTRAVRDVLAQLASKGFIEFGPPKQERCLTILGVKFVAKVAE